MIRGRVIMGFPDSKGSSKISVENDRGKHFIGTVECRGSRYFPVDHNRFPLPGAFKTKRQAAAALQEGVLPVRIIIDIDDEVWSEAWGEWDEKLPDRQSYLDTGKSNWAKHTKIVRDRVVAAVGMPIEKIRMIEEPTDDEHFGEDEGDEG